MRNSLLLLFVASFLSLQMNCQVLGEPVITWDFANGIPNDWIVGINSTTDLAHWEYRGPNTEPNTTVGARGSCSALAVPLLSETQSNGFVIFDGNFWDDSGNLCGLGLGTGPDPAPHTAWLITPPIDLSAASGPVLTFQQQFRSFQATTRVQISTDLGITWTDILVNSGIQSPNSVWASVSLADYTAGQTNVQFKFLYEGTYYWWLLDDITVFVPNENDIMLTSKFYTNNSGINSEFALFNMQYDQYPLLQIPAFNFKGSCQNIGSQTQNNVTLNATIIKDNTDEVYNQSSPSPDVDAFAIQSLVIPGSYVNAPVEGDYKIYYTVSQQEIDQTPGNNVDSLDYSITEYTYALDEGEMENSYLPNSTFAPYQMEAGCFYHAFNEDSYCHSLQVAVAEGTVIGSGIHGMIYNQSMDTLLIRTDTVYVNAADLNSPGDSHMMTLHFPEPFELIADSVYFVAMGEIDSTMDVSVARSGTTYGESGLIRFPSINATLVSAKVPMVRMNVFPALANTGCTDPTAMDYDAGATTDDGSCHYSGCTNENADNYVPFANFDDGSCVVGGCTDPQAANYDPAVDYENGTCQYPGCTDPTAVNYDNSSNFNDGSCQFIYAYIQATSLSGCPPLTFQITNNNEFVEGSSCSFMLNTTAINEICSPAFEYTIEEPGTYELYYEFMVNNALADTTISIVVFDYPASATLLYDEPSSTISCTNCSSDAYQWFNDGDIINGETNSSINIFFDNTYQNGLYSLESTNDFGCSSQSSELLILQPYFIGNTDEACLPVAYIAADLSDVVSGSECFIDFGDGSQPEVFNGNLEHLFTTPGEYTITVTCELNGTNGQYIQNLVVHDILLPLLIHNAVNNQIECSNCDEFESVEWLIDGALNTGNGPFPDDAHLYQVTGTTINDCSGTSLIVLNSENAIEKKEPTIYPVPADSELTISGISIKPEDIKVYDLMGRVIISDIKTSPSSVLLNTSNMAAGQYTIAIQTSEGTWNKQIEIRH